ncbi:MAG: cytochrome P450 [Gordonia sp. (in: high G+C Gram-positive bacteria)]|uniref:cytochrome P450 n=1 Tax=Gordonia sp. (in: high G+C Gram-positive bacteria) TaxID=84139 RepID=UPI003BB581E3
MPLSRQARAAFVLRSEATWDEPFSMYAELRRHDPVHYVADGDYWVLSRHADVLAAASDAATFSSAQGLTVTYGELEAIGMADHPPLVMQDPPAHTAFRRLVARGFTPRQVAAVQPQVQAFVTARLDELAATPAGDPADIVDRLLKPLPSMVVAHYLGVPESDRANFDAWTEAIVGATSAGGLGAAATTAAAATAEMAGYFADLVNYRRSHPGEDTVSQLVSAGVADDDLLAVLAFTFTMVAGGNDTTTGLLGGGLALLAAAPKQRRALADDPGLIPEAVEELLRLTCPVQGLARTTTRAVTYAETPRGPVTIPAGKKVLLCYASANRDTDEYGPDAERLDITRRPRNLLTFSHGHHHCLGAAAARMQATVTLTELLARFGNFAVDPGGITWAAGNYVRRPTYVPFFPG